MPSPSSFFPLPKMLLSSVAPDRDGLGAAVFSGGLIVVVVCRGRDVKEIGGASCSCSRGVRCKSRLCNTDPRSCCHAVVGFGAFKEVAEWDAPLTISIKSYSRASFAATKRIRYTSSLHAIEELTVLYDKVSRHLER